MERAIAERGRYPAIDVLRPIPAIAWVPMSIMLWPTNETSICFITFLGAFYPILVNTIHGVHSLDGVLIRAARCLGASEFRLFLNVILPGSLPHIFTGLAVGMGVAWVSLIAAEMISGQFGVGYFTWEALIRWWTIPRSCFGMITIGFSDRLQRHHPDGRRSPDALAGIRTRRQAMTMAMTDTEIHKGFIDVRDMGVSRSAPTTTRSLQSRTFRSMCNPANSSACWGRRAAASPRF
jgi:hypothetical protein